MQDGRDFPCRPTDLLYGNNSTSRPIWPQPMDMHGSTVLPVAICRLCMVKGGSGSTMENIFRNEATNLIALQIMWVTQLEVQHGDGLPSQVCQQCIFQLNVAHNFKQRCVESDKSLRQLYAKEAITSTISSNGLNSSRESSGTIEIDQLVLKAEPLSPCNFDETNNDALETESQADGSQREMKIEIVEHDVEIENEDAVVGHTRKTKGAGKKKPGNKKAVKCSKSSKTKVSHVCETCNKIYATWDLLRRHRLYHREKTLPCTVCGVKFLRPAALKRHMYTHTNERPFSCKVCGTGFRAKNTLDIHVRSHSGVKLFSCQLCEKSFAHKSTLTTHIRVHENDKPYKCSYCPIAFPAKGALTKHLRIHTNCRPNPCKLCPKAFTTPAGLRNHIRIHNNEKPYKCTFLNCNKAFTQTTGLSVHKLIHTGEKPWHCNWPKCVKSFVQKGTLDIHIRTHKNLRPYLCDLCGKGFYTKRSLGRHISHSHLNLKDFQCKVCDKWFARQTGLVSHMNIHTDSRPYKCTYRDCLKTFRQRTSMLTHLRTHTGDKRFECGICRMRFVQKSTLNTHFRIHSKEKPFKCKLCKQAFAQSGNLTDHIKRHHVKKEKKTKEKKTKEKKTKEKSSRKQKEKFIKQEKLIKEEELTMEVESLDIEYEEIETHNDTASNCDEDTSTIRPTGKFYTCELCFDTFPRKRGLISHVKNKHSFDEEEISEDEIRAAEDSPTSTTLCTQVDEAYLCERNSLNNRLNNSIVESGSAHVLEGESNFIAHPTITDVGNCVETPTKSNENNDSCEIDERNLPISSSCEKNNLRIVESLKTFHESSGLELSSDANDVVKIQAQGSDCVNTNSIITSDSNKEITNLPSTINTTDSENCLVDCSRVMTSVDNESTSPSKGITGTEVHLCENGSFMENSFMLDVNKEIVESTTANDKW